MANEKINILVEARDNASTPLKGVRNEIDKVGASATKTAAASKNITNSLGGVGRSAGQAGIQMQQFIGQIQGGVNPMVALSQQGTDLGFVLGVPLLGAIVGIGASLAGMFIPSLIDSSNATKDLRKEIDKVFKSFGEMTPAVRNFVQLDLQKQIKEQERAARNASVEMERLAIQMRLNADSSQESVDKLLSFQTTAALAEAKASALEETLEKLKSTNKEENEAVTRLTESLQEQVIGLDANIVEIFKYRAIKAKATEDELKQIVALAQIIQANKDQAEATKKAAEEQRNKAQALVKAANEDQRSRDAAERLKKTLIEQAQSLKESVDPWARYNRLIAEYNTHLAEGRIDLEYFVLLQNKLEEETVKAAAGIEEVDKATEKMSLTMQNVRATGIRSLEDGLVGIITQTTSVKDAFRSMASAILADLARMTIRKSITAPLAQNFGLTSFDGGGYTGSGGRSGGVDGKGGFPAILHPNETVIDHTKGQGMGGAVSVTLNISTGVSQTVRAEIANLMPQITEATKAGVLEARQRGGSYSRALAGI